jgi:hypothetical protein
MASVNKQAGRRRLQLRESLGTIREVHRLSKDIATSMLNPD